MTTAIGYEREARFNALSLIHNQLTNGSYQQGTIFHTSYLGPDIKTLSMFDRDGGGDTGLEVKGSESSSSPPSTYYIAIGVLSLALFSLCVFLIMALRLRMTRKRAASTV